MVLEKDNECSKVDLIISIQKIMAPVWSFDVFFKVKVWERLYLLSTYRLVWENQTQLATELELYIGRFFAAFSIRPRRPQSFRQCAEPHNVTV